MKIITMQENLKRGLAIVLHAIAGKSTLPVLAHVLLTSDGNRLKLSATNLEVGITHWMGATVQEEGAITIPARLLADVIGGLPNDQVTLTLDPRTQTLKVACGRFTSNIKGMEAEEFPGIPAPQGNPDLRLPASLLTAGIAQTAFAAAGDDSRPVLAGVYLQATGRTLMLAAADGFRMAYRTITLPEPVETRCAVIVPARALEMVGKVFAATEGGIDVTVLASQIAFESAETCVVSRLIDGKFPDVARIIPTLYSTRTVVDVAALRKAVKLASYFASASQHTLKLTMQAGGELGPGQLTLTANAAEIGDNTGSVEGVIHGEGGQIALNAKYLAEFLESLDTPQVAIETQSALTPAIFKPVGQEGSVHVIMPMSLR